jgi:hypothetical protein
MSTLRKFIEATALVHGDAAKVINDAWETVRADARYENVVGTPNGNAIDLIDRVINGVVDLARDEKAKAEKRQAPGAGAA